MSAAKAPRFAVRGRAAQLAEIAREAGLEDVYQTMTFRDFAVVVERRRQGAAR